MIKKLQSKVIEIDLPPYSITNDGKIIQPLYPHTALNLRVVFVHGTDFQQEKFRSVKPNQNFDLNLAGLLAIAACVLCFLRRKKRLPRNGLISSYIDVSVTVFGGGNHRFHHSLEKFLLAFLLIGGIFLNTFWLECVLFPSYLILDRSIKTFNELANINPPIFIRSDLASEEGIIGEMIRFVEFH